MNGTEEILKGEQPEQKGHLIDFIASSGNLILEVQEDRTGEVCPYRVDAAVLRVKSRYFDRLLDPKKFTEGRQTSATLAALGDLDLRDDPSVLARLPRVRVTDVGRISHVSSIRKLCADFLQVLHGGQLSSESMPLANLANLAVVADRFDALETVAEYAQKHRLMQAVDGKSRRQTGGLLEEKARQRILVGLLLDHPDWVTIHSKPLITLGSMRWAEADADDRKALWWDLPQGVEDELLIRREYALETIESIYTYFIQLYSSNERQCKLGYDSSPQCDSFQLGEMVRFLTRNKLVDWSGKLLGKDTTSTSFTLSLDHVLDTLRKCPSYQIDRNHAHCGLRSRLMPLLELIEPYISSNSRMTEIGICGDCWRRTRHEYSWAEAKPPVSWSRDAASRSNVVRHMNGHGDRCLQSHIAVRDMFTAVTRDWTTQDGPRDIFSSRPTLGMKKIP